MTRRKTILEPVVAVFAAAYFLFDALFLSILRPLLKRVAHLKFFQLVTAWIETLGPYSTLAVFLIPVIVLEPIKPVSAYLVASGHLVNGILILVLGEALKITIVERIFHIARPKLMTIEAFARTYAFVVGWLTWAQGLPPWLAVKRKFADIGRWARKLHPRHFNRSRHAPAKSQIYQPSFQPSDRDRRRSPMTC